jgi:NAD-dependent dihydropyrimidine dehydrogenase PreA subunit
LGVFIQIDIDKSKVTPEIGQALVLVCPVDIFDLEHAQLVVRPEQEDECTLCELCLAIAPKGALTIWKTYKAEQLVSQGGGV